MCCTRLVFSTSKKIARRVLGSGRSGSGGRAAARAANASSGSASGSSAEAGSGAGSTGAGGSGAIGAGGGDASRGLRRCPPRRRLVGFLDSVVTSRLQFRARLERITDGQARQAECTMPRMSEPAATSREADVLFELVRGRYGDRLTPEQLESVRRGVAAIVEQAAALRAVRLDNADEPVQRFVPFRADE